MALLDFPSGPGSGDTYTLNGNTWKWNGTSWTAFNSLSLSSQVTGILAVQYGGTGFGGTYTAGDILYASSSNTFAKLAAGTAGSVLASGGTGAAPYWKVDDSGTGSVGNGTTGGFAYYNGLNTITSGTAFSYINGGGAGGTGATVVLTQSSLALIGSTITSGTWAGSAITAKYGGTGLNSLTAGDLIYGSATDTYSKLGHSGAAGSVLVTIASSGLAWTTLSSLSVGTATSSTYANTIVTDAVTATRYLVGTPLNTASSGGTVLSTGSGITIGNNLLTSSGIAVSGSTASTSTTTGALTVSGGVGIGGSLWTSSTNYSSISGVGLTNGAIIGGTWAGTAISLTYGGTNGTRSGLAISYQLAVYNSTGTGITQVGSGTASSILSQADANTTPTWVGQSTLFVGAATSAAQVNIAQSTAARYLIGVNSNSSANSAQLSTGSGVSVADNLLIAGAIGVTNTTVATSTSTGALTVSGGVGIGGSLWTASGNYSSVSGVALQSGAVTGGTWAGTAVSLTYGGTNGTRSGLAISYQLAVYNSTGTGITQVGSGAGSSILFQANANTAPTWVGQSTLTGIVTSLTAGNGIQVSSSTGNVTVSNIGVTTITGAANQISVTSSLGSSNGAISLSLPQSIATNSAVQFDTVSVRAGTLTTTSFSNATDMVNKQYVDNLASGLDVHGSVRAISVTGLGASYVQSSTGGSSDAIGAYLISTSFTTLPNIDTTVAFGSTGPTQRILVAGGIDGKVNIGGTGYQASTGISYIANGIYYVSSLGSGSTNWILIRATDTDTNTELTAGTFTFVEEGTSYADTGWVCTNDTTNLGPIGFGITQINFSQFTGAAAFNTGQGLTKTGNTVATKINLSSTGTASGTGFTQFNIGGAAGGGVADTGYYPTFSVRTSGTVAGTAILTLNQTGFSLVGSTNTPATLTITGDISLPSPTQYGIAYGSGSNAVSFLAAGGSGASVLTQTSGSNPAYLGQSQLFVGAATSAAQVNIAQSTAARYLIGVNSNSSTNSAQLSTGSGVSVADNLLIAGAIGVTNTTVATSTSTGALTVSGGVGIGGSLWTASGNYSSVSGVALQSGAITGGTWAGTAISLTYGGTNGTRSGLAISYQLAVYNSTGTGITQVGSGTASSILFQTDANTAPTWVGQSTLVVGGATTAGIATSAAQVNIVQSTAARYLIGTALNTSSGSTQLSTGSGVSVADNLLIAGAIGVTNTTGSASTTTGALTVSGGVGIGGSLWTSATNHASVSGLGISNGVVLSGTWSGTAISVAKGGTGLLTVNANQVLIGASTGNTWTAIGSTLLPVAAISSTPPAQPGGAIGGTQPGQLWWDSEYGVLKIYYTDATPTSQWVDATPVLGSSGGGSSTKRSYVMTFGAGFTPSTGADTVQILIPYAPDNTAKYYYIKRLDYRAETAGTGVSFYIERFTGGNAAFNVSSGNRIHSASGASFVTASGTLITSYTLSSSGASFVSSSGVAGSVISGDYLRLNYSHVNSAATMSVSIILEEQ
jgi:hypothetical protein